MQKCYNKMNKLLDDSAEVANKMNPRGYMVLPTSLFLFLRHILVETCIYCSHTRSKLLTITAQLMVRKKVQTCSSSNPSIINMKYFFGWCNKLEASIQIWTSKKSLSVLQNNGKLLINWFYPVTNHAQTSPISLPVCSHLIHLQHKGNSFTSIQL